MIGVRGVPANAELLSDAPYRPVFLVDGVVHRPSRFWTPTVQRLLRHLHADGCPFVPEPLGYDDEWERLRFVPGRSGGDGWTAVHSDDGLRAFGALLRSLHEALAGYPASDQDRWAFSSGVPEPGLVLCHNDFGPWNVVWDAERPVAILDWDFVAPGHPFDDVAYALRYVAPFESDERCRDWLRYEQPPSRRHRTELFLDACGVKLDLHSVPSLVSERSRLTARHVEHLARLGVQPQKEWVESGSWSSDLEHADWVDRNGHRLLGLDDGDPRAGSRSGSSP